MLLTKSINTLNEYLNGIMHKSNQQARNVNEVALTIARAIIWRATGDIKIREEKGYAANNKLWFYVKDRRYVLTYNQLTETMDLMDIEESILDTFDNSSKASKVKNIFGKL